MDFNHIIISEADIVYRDMITGETSVPLSKNVSVSDIDTYSKKRDNYLQRLNREKNAFKAAVNKIIDNRDQRLKYEKERKIEKQQKKERVANFIKTLFFWIIVASLVAVNLLFEKKLLRTIVDNELNGSEMFDGVWASTWPAWIALSVMLLLTAVIGLVLLKKKDASVVCFLEVVALLVFSIVLAFIFPPCDSLIENIIGLPILCAILYVAPVVVSGFFSLAICGSKK